jgi:fatty acid desaturase
MEKVQIPSALYRLNPIRFMWRLLIWGTIVTLCVGVLVLGQGLLAGILALPAAIILGLMYAHGVELQHWCLHHIAFRPSPYSKRLHRCVGILLGLPMLVAYSHYRARHLEHHRWLGTPKDKEFFDYTRRFGSWTALLVQAFSLRRYPRVFREMWNALRGRVCPDARSPEEARHIRQEYCLMAVLLVAAAGFSLAWPTLVVLKLWVLPLLLSAEAGHYLIELPEHFGCETGTRDLMRNTRTIVGSAFSHWLTAGNNFHVEHHVHAGVPPERLVDLHALLAPQMRYVVRSYWAFFQSVVRR